ncbi:hypothetical protein GB2207_01272 [gamma proteobacterium HTCC2207]|uniref:DNA internalization-related competence protein ComEC/Rec2 n=1 Tax=gamma proteobacterium HTCC2207 TaxID=314287 RepID=Q1YTU5_9GAMM|nr:hypothetical protein GB2207_01272 [gamma proteobacterium HTCC2207]
MDLLIAPHHGSKTSSTPRFVQQLRPKNVVFSAGFQHQFGHPHPSVTKRYDAVQSQIWNTAEQGAITFEWLDSSEATRQHSRQHCRQYFKEHSIEHSKEPCKKLAGALKITTARGQAQRWWR